MMTRKKSAGNMKTRRNRVKTSQMMVQISWPKDGAVDVVAGNWFVVSQMLSYDG